MTILKKGFNRAFTLAEVLITLGIIGVVAAMTIPTLMANYQKHQVVTRLQAFYSKINQALRLSQEEYGELAAQIEHDASQKQHPYEYNLEILQKYIGPFIKISNYRQCESSSPFVCVDMFDGGTMGFGVYGQGYIDIIYVLKGKYEDRKKGKKTQKTFYFRYSHGSEGETDRDDGNIIKPYDAHWDGTREGLKNNGEYYPCKPGCLTCNHCAKLIQISGWKIPDDYPW